MIKFLYFIQHNFHKLEILSIKFESKKIFLAKFIEFEDLTISFEFLNMH